MYESSKMVSLTHAAGRPLMNELVDTIESSQISYRNRVRGVSQYLMLQGSAPSR